MDRTKGQARNEEHYRARAKELRVIAGSVDDATARVTLLDIAEQYEQMAAVSELRRGFSDVFPIMKAAPMENEVSSG